MNFKRIGRALLYPPFIIPLILLPVSVVLLVHSMVYLDEASAVAICSYVLSAYTLTVWCFRIPDIIKTVKYLRNENKLILRWREDTRLRVNVSLYGTFIWNAAYGVFQLWLGFYHNTFWYYSFAAYYILLAVMRYFLVRFSRANEAGAKLRDELIRYRACGIIFLFMNLSLALIVFFMVYWGRTFVHHEITTIAMAAFTFTSLTLAIINNVKYRKYNSPVYSASKAISLASASVSMLTLESTMLTTFGDGTVDPLTHKILLGSSGGAIIAFVVAMAVYMIVQSTWRLRQIEVEGGDLLQPDKDEGGN